MQIQRADTTQFSCLVPRPSAGLEVALLLSMYFCWLGRGSFYTCNRVSFTKAFLIFWTWLFLQQSCFLHSIWVDDMIYFK